MSLLILNRGLALNNAPIPSNGRVQAYWGHTATNTGHQTMTNSSCRRMSLTSMSIQLRDFLKATFPAITAALIHTIVGIHHESVLMLLDLRHRLYHRKRPYKTLDIRDHQRAFRYPILTPMGHHLLST
jgi:hypothetical protein